MTATAPRSTTLLQQTFTSLLDSAEFIAALKEQDLSLLFVQHEPNAVVFVSADGIAFDETTRNPTLRFELSGDTTHQLLTGRLSLPRAAAARQLQVKGPVNRLRQLTTVLPIVGATYAGLAARA